MEQLSDKINSVTCASCWDLYTRIMLHSLFYLETALHASGGTITHHQERKLLSTVSGICHTVTATCRYRGRVGAGLSVLWVAYGTHSEALQIQFVAQLQLFGHRISSTLEGIILELLGLYVR